MPKITPFEGELETEANKFILPALLEGEVLVLESNIVQGAAVKRLRVARGYGVMVTNYRIVIAQGSSAVVCTGCCRPPLLENITVKEMWSDEVISCYIDYERFDHSAGLAAVHITFKGRTNKPLIGLTAASSKSGTFAYKSKSACGCFSTAFIGFRDKTKGHATPFDVTLYVTKDNAGQLMNWATERIQRYQLVKKLVDEGKLMEGTIVPTAHPDICGEKIFTCEEACEGDSELLEATKEQKRRRKALAEEKNAKFDEAREVLRRKKEDADEKRKIEKEDAAEERAIMKEDKAFHRQLDKQMKVDRHAFLKAVQMARFEKKEAENGETKVYHRLGQKVLSAWETVVDRLPKSIRFNDGVNLHIRGDENKNSASMTATKQGGKVSIKAEATTIEAE